MAVEDLLSILNRKESFKENVVAWRTLPARPADYATMPRMLRPDLKEALHAQGIDQLYSHQQQALKLAFAGQDLVVATPTASGKTLCYNIPVIQRLLEDPSATALYLFPTKALSQDQVAAFGPLNPHLARPLKTMTYDGDTPTSARKRVRESGDVVVTNPHMLHTGILPNHTRWVRFFQGLSFVVIDEVHTLTGVFGSHFANLIRRLLRLCRHYGSAPIFILSSATLANPSELASRLIGRPVAAVRKDGSPRGEKHFVFYNPPVVNPELGIRRSSLEEARRIATLCSENSLQTLTFCRSRTAVEVLVKYLKDHYSRQGLDVTRVRGYRGGYLPLLRRQIEKGLRQGEIDAVVATNALELGIDIGSLDACILNGYPGSVASTLQQAGRSGRKASPSLAVVIGRSHAADQFVVHHPDYILEQAPESGAIDPDNLLIRTNQLKCAAFELPFQADESFGGQGDTLEILNYLEKEAKILRRVKDRWYWMSRTFPAERVSLNAGDMDNFVVYDRDERQAIGEVDRASAMSMIYPGAIYGHQGSQYFIEELDFVKRRAKAARVESDYYTEADLETEIQVQHLNHSLDYGDYAVHLGEIGLVKAATLFKKIRFYTRENLGTGPINLPSERMHTEALFLTLSKEAALKARIYETIRSVAFYGLGKLFQRVVPLYVRCDTADLGVKTEIASAHFDLPTIILYDSIPGGVGLSAAAVEVMKPVLLAMRAITANCTCAWGCPCCVDPAPDAGRAHKTAVLELIELLLLAGDRPLKKNFRIEEDREPPAEEGCEWT